MTESQMTERILRALEDPRLTILGHPTGRLLLTREAYAVNVEAVIERAVELGVALELNCDPHRLDLDWRWLREARERGATVEIGPDAHSPEGLDNMQLGVGIARKAWLRREDVLNALEVDDVAAFARARRARPAPHHAGARREDDRRDDRQKRSYAVNAEAVELVHGAQNAGPLFRLRLAIETKRFEKAGEHVAVVDADLKIAGLKACRFERSPEHHDTFDIRMGRWRADRVRVALLN